MTILSCPEFHRRGEPINPLLAIALGLLPDLVRLLAGDRNGTLANKIVTTVKDVTKSSDEAGVQKAVAEDPAVRSALQKQLADIALEETKSKIAPMKRSAASSSMFSRSSTRKPPAPARTSSTTSGKR